MNEFSLNLAKVLTKIKSLLGLDAADRVMPSWSEPDCLQQYADSQSGL